MKILLIGGGNPATSGGVLKFWQFLSSDLISRGVEVAYLANTDVRPPHLFYELDPDVKVFGKSYSSLGNGQFLQQLSTEFSPEIIFLKFSNRRILRVLKEIENSGLNVRLIRGEQGGIPYLVRTQWNRSWAQRLSSFQSADLIHLLSKGHLYESRFPADLLLRSVLITSPYPSELDQYPPPLVQVPRKTLIFVGRLEKYEKRADRFLRLVKKLIARKIDVNIKVIGDGALFPEFDELGRAHASVQVYGEVPSERVYTELSKGGVLVNTSAAEGAPITIAEAFRFGVPVIGFREARGVADRVKHGTNGVLVTTEAQLFRSVLSLIEDSDLHCRLSEGAVLSSEQYQPIRIANRWAAAINRVKLVEETRAPNFQSNLSFMHRSEMVELLPTHQQTPLQALSVVIPIFNNFDRTLRYQTVFNELAGLGCELVLVDDGSTRIDKKALMEFASECDAKLISIENSGVGSARNVGILSCTREFITFCDADDYVDVTSLGKAVHFLAANHEYDYFIGLLCHGIVNRRDTVTYEYRSKYKIYHDCVSARELENSFEYGLEASLSNKVFRRDFFFKTGLFIPEKIRMEDFLFCQVARDFTAKVMVSNLTLGYYMKYKGGPLTSTQTWPVEKMDDALLVYTSLKKYYKDNADLNKYERNLVLDVYFRSIFSVIGKSDSDLARVSPELLARSQMQKSFLPTVIRLAFFALVRALMGRGFSKALLKRYRD